MLPRCRTADTTRRIAATACKFADASSRFTGNFIVIEAKNVHRTHCHAKLVCIINTGQRHGTIAEVAVRVYRVEHKQSLLLGVHTAQQLVDDVKAAFVRRLYIISTSNS
jgi:hypothetical protein